MDAPTFRRAGAVLLAAGLCPGLDLRQGQRTGHQWRTEEKADLDIDLVETRALAGSVCRPGDAGVPDPARRGGQHGGGGGTESTRLQPALERLALAVLAAAGGDRTGGWDGRLSS